MQANDYQTMLKSISIGKKAVLLIVLVLAVDQFVKIWIKTHMMYYGNIDVIGNWFRIYFIENNGMAFGMEFGGSIGKTMLSIFRLIAIGGIIWYLNYLVKNKAHGGLILSIALVLAGAVGNIIDSMFYGMIFNQSTPATVATLFPEGGGYSSFLHGKVVDMLYFPLINGHFPNWFPFVGGQEFQFFRPVFNLADSSITIGVIIILLFQKRFFGLKAAEPVAEENQPQSAI